MRLNQVMAIGIGTVLTAQLGLTSTTHAVISGGGGSKTTDCLAVFDAPVNSPVGNPKHVVCEDGTACDEDMDTNGVCEVSIRVCANNTSLPDCTLSGVQSISVDHALDNGDPKFDPEFQALQTRIDSDITPPTLTSDVCTNLSTFRVAVKGPLSNNRCRKRGKKLRVRTASDVIGGRVYNDSDTLKITCVPSTAMNGCDPQTFYDNTYDRIQKQIFNQSCAVSSCHDSESQAGGLLLETGASHATLVNQDPANGAALGNGWKRVAPGDLVNSFLVHKLSGDLPNPALGERMPFGKPKLPTVLRDIVDIWIQAGAPDGTGGWIPGTFEP
jgi:hypothetical protein